jgi:hypothetical protein
LPAERLVLSKTTPSPPSNGWLGQRPWGLLSHMRPDDFPISVTADWRDWRWASARLGDLRDVHWHQPKGAPHAMVHAFLSCADVSGEFSHACDPSSAPHSVRVCILRSHNLSAAYAELTRRADQARVASCPPSALRFVSTWSSMPTRG